MSTLLDLTTQGDVATISDESQLDKVKLMTPQQLYELWEKQNWQAHGVDLSRDRETWESLDEADRAEILWGLSSFFIGEERVTTQFSGLVMAYDDESEESFLTTQQVDEARHAQFFNRFYREVLGVDEPDWSAQLARVREEVTDSFVKLFDEALVEANQALIADPADREAKVRFVTTYHMVIEGALALTGQNFITQAFEERGIVPGFVEGFGLISRDEHRHVAYGTWYLREAVRQDPGVAGLVAETLSELIPHAAGVLVPKGKSIEDDWTLLGYSNTEVNEFAFNALNRRLRVIGIDFGAAAPEPAPA
jgi:ribonucleoside-diphosphate reductase beta chain